MGVAAGIGIQAAFTHGLVGLSRRPHDRVRIAFAVAAAAVAVGALAVLAMYSASTAPAYVAIMKWVSLPAGVVWMVATVWLVAFFGRAADTVAPGVDGRLLCRGRDQFRPAGRADAGRD